MEQWLEFLGQWFDKIFDNSSGVMNMVVVFATIAIAAFVVTMLAVKSSEK